MHLLPSKAQPQPADMDLICMPDVVSSSMVFESESICLIAHTIMQSVHHCNSTERQRSPETFAIVDSPPNAYGDL